MTREQIIKNLEYLIQFLPGKSIYAEKTLTCAIAALRGPVPDPETGLVPCWCGGKAVDNEGIDYGYGYKCQKCGIATTAGSNRDCAKEDWNTAMGWKGGAE